MSACASPSPSSTRQTSSRSAAKSAQCCRNDAGADDAVGDGYAEDLLTFPAVRCDFIAVPPDFKTRFAYLHDTQLFFFDVLQKMNRMHAKGRRVCFITDYTINLASPATGTVSRCSKVEDVAELVCDIRSRAVGIRMRDRPFAVQPHHFLHWNCFFEMPVDLLLFADSQQQLSDLMRVLRVVYQQCTQQELPCRVLEPREEWEAILVLWPDGSRVKKNAMLYHRVPDATAQPVAGPPPPLANRAVKPEEMEEEGNRGQVEVPPSRGSRSASASPASSPPQRLPLSLRHRDASPSSSPPPPPLIVAPQLGVPTDTSLHTPHEAGETATASAATPLHPRVARGVAAETYSATRRRDNPLAREWPSQSGATRAYADVDDDDDEALAALYTPPTPPAQRKAAKSSHQVRALEAVVREQQRRIHELRQSSYSKECELDDLKRHLSTTTTTTMSPPPATAAAALAVSQHGPEASVHRKQIHLPGPLDGVAGRGTPVHLQVRESDTTSPFHVLDGSSAGSSSSSHGAHLSTVKPLPSAIRKSAVAAAHEAQ